MPARLVVFLDYQNVYSIARAPFHPALAPAQAGQIDPLKLGELIAAKSSDRDLAQVRVYRGRPDSEKDPRGYGANLRQCTQWERDPRVRVIWRTLRYPRNWPQEKEEEKGIDVALAIDFVTMAVRGEYDVGMIVPTDTDLKPALEAVAQMRGSPVGFANSSAARPVRFRARAVGRGRGACSGRSCICSRGICSRSCGCWRGRIARGR